MIDLGPAAGEHGGEVCIAGKTSKLLNSKNGFDSFTLSYLNNKKRIEIPAKQERELENH